MVQTELDDEHLPEWMETEEMRQAMNTLRQFSENERSYQLYQARLNYLHQQRSIQKHLEALRVEAEQARAAEEQARAEKEAARAAEERQRVQKQAALAEIARLKALLQGC